jgi:membrane protein DedA with SNARE-associated domain
MENMFDQAQIVHLVSTYGYWAIFFVVSLESAGIPLPGETVLVGAAIYAGQTGGLAIERVILAAAAGAIVGDNIGYWVGREFGTGLLERHGHYIGVTPQKLRLGQYLFMRWGGWIVFVGRFIALLRMLAAVLAGANRLEPGRFFLFNATGGLLWAHVFGLGGYYLTSAFTRIEGPFAFAAFVLVALGIVHIWQYVRANEKRLLEEAEAAIAAKSAERAS